MSNWPRRDSMRRWEWRTACLSLLTIAAGVGAQPTVAPVDSLENPFAALSRSGERSLWPALQILRTHEVAYLASENWRAMYAQLRAQLEASFGNHAEALRLFDAALPQRTARPSYNLPAGIRAVDAVSVILAAAETSRVVMMNERHHAAPDRLLTFRLLAPLWAKGYRYLAAEALSWADSGLMARGYPLEQITGGYTDEPVFAVMLREALRLGYTIVPYEAEPRQLTADSVGNPQERRDRAQAENLYRRTLRRDSSARVIVHAGYAHIHEQRTTDWQPMAVYFKEMSGLNPLTIDQTGLSERSERSREAAPYEAALGLKPVGPAILVDSTGRPFGPRQVAVDLQVVSPRTRFDSKGRPEWMTLAGTRQAVDVPVAECAVVWCLLEARLAGEPGNAAVLDRVEGRGATLRLYLPRRSRVRLRIVTMSGATERMLDAGA